VNFHEERGDKIIIFSDDRFAIEELAKALVKPFIHGDVGANERQCWLDKFKQSEIQTIFLSKVGDTSIDIPDANVII
jgi:DNA excision repair protein ERCC-3